MVSPYLLRRCRTYDEFLRDRAARLALRKNAETRAPENTDHLENTPKPEFTEQRPPR